MSSATDSTASGPPLSKTAYVLERLRREIADGLIKPGTSLRQTDVAKRYGVSPTPVREAFRLLEAEGALNYESHRGATVKDMTPQEIEDLHLLRSEVEGLATALAVERMEDAALDRIRAAHQDLNDAIEAGDQSRLPVLNRALHFAIYEAGSSLVALQAASLWAFVPPRMTIWKDEKNARSLSDDHRRIIDALERGDPYDARRSMAEHILHAARLRRNTPPPA
ncbi:GntR family transcriptional regulator [Actinomadura decatromicini]|uniref:GntR family transcriptional regulator n=1 Tax=Actinomadura decatromicini TaxID=2604572 RepID=A0A5D3F696_9ACTN|nr:GntR family transcriptional regulator [Actinomadura decatromicini]TYK44547.1 GntR family transcriptional regulator [Actinomadura decatromicini]